MSTPFSTGISDQQRGTLPASSDFVERVGDLAAAVGGPVDRLKRLAADLENDPAMAGRKMAVLADHLTDMVRVLGEGHGRVRVELHTFLAEDTFGAALRSVRLLEARGYRASLEWHRDEAKLVDGMVLMVETAA